MELKDLYNKLADDPNNAGLKASVEEFTKQVEKCSRLVVECLELNEITVPIGTASLLILSKILMQKLTEDPTFQEFKKMKENK